MAAVQKRLAPRNFSQDWTADIFGESGAPTTGAYSVLTVNPAGDRNALKFIARTAGVAGDDITIQYQKQAVADVPIAVTVTVKAILVKLQKTGGGAVVNTAVDVAAAIQANADSRALVRTEYVDDNGPSTENIVIVTETGPTHLAGGVDSSADQAWALIGTIPAGAEAQLSQVRCDEAFDVAGGGDHGDIALFAVQPDAVSIAWTDAPLGTHLSATDAVGIKAKDVTTWLTTMDGSLSTDIYAVLTSHDANDLATITLLDGAPGKVLVRVIHLV